MSLERDLQSELAIVICDTIDIDQEALFTSSAVDTFGFRNLTFALDVDVELDPGDIINIGAQESADGVTWTQLTFNHLLPERRWGDQVLVNAANGYLQTMGVISAERYVRFTATAAALVSRQISISVAAVLVPEIRDFTAWDPDVVSDGNP